MNHFYCYMYVDPATGVPFYVGKGQRSRAWSYTAHSHNKWLMSKLDDIRNNYKSKEFVVVVEENLTEEQAFEMEEELVNKYGKRFDGGILWNIADGGARGAKNTGMTWTHSEETKQKYKDAWTPERKEQMSGYSKRYVRDESWCRKISESKRKFKFDKKAFEELVQEGFKSKEIRELWGISMDILRDRLNQEYGTPKFREVIASLKPHLQE